MLQIFEDTFRELRPRTPIPEIRVSFFRFASVNNTIRLREGRLTGAAMYSTIEPCAMCAGALIHARIGRLVYGAKDERAGAVDTHFGICTTDFLNHRVKVEGGILEAECREMIQSFFRGKRRASNAERCESG